MGKLFSKRAKAEISGKNGSAGGEPQAVEEVVEKTTTEGAESAPVSHKLPFEKITGLSV